MSKVFDFDARYGSLYDRVNNEYPTLYTEQGTPKFVRADKGLALDFNGTHGQDKYIYFANTDQRYTFGSAVSISVWVRNSTKKYTQGLIQQGWANLSGNRTWEFDIWSNSLRFQIWGETGYVFKVSNITLTNNTVCYSVVFDGVNYSSIKLYENGVDIGGVGSMTADYTPPILDLSIIIGQLYSAGAAFYGAINRIQLFNHELTTDEIAADYAEFQKSEIIAPPKRGFVYPKPTDLSGETDLVAAWNMIQNENKIIPDITGNGYDITMDRSYNSYIRQGFSTFDKGLYSPPQAAILNYSATRGYLINPISLESGRTFEFYEENILYNIADTAQQTLGIKYQRPGFQTAFRIRSDYGILVIVKTTAGYQTIRFRYPNHLSVGQKLLGHCVFNIADKPINCRAWLNGGELVNQSTNTDDIIPVNLDKMLPFGYVGMGTHRWIKDIKVWNRQLTEQEIKDKYNQYANEIYLYENFEGNGADGLDALPKGWSNQGRTGSWAIKELPTREKYMECLGTGNINIPSKQAYGTWEFDVYTNTNNQNNDYKILNDLTNYYSFRLKSNGTYSLTINGTDVITGTVLTADTWYSVKITRYYNGLFTLYLNGTEIGTYTHTTYTDCKYFSCNLTSNYAVKNIVMKKGVEV